MAKLPPSPLSHLPPPPGSESAAPAPIASPKKFPLVPVILGAVAVLAVAVGVTVVVMKKKGGADKTDSASVADSTVEVVPIKLKEARPDYGISSKNSHGLTGTFYATDSAQFGTTFMAEFLAGKLDHQAIVKHAKVAENTLSTARIMYLPRPPKEVAQLFGDTSGATRWVTVYRGKVVAPFSGKFRFAGFGMEQLGVRFDGRSVFSNKGEPLYALLKSERWAGDPIAGGEWITVEKGKVYPIEIALQHGSSADARYYLMVQLADKAYPANDKGAPIYESFRVLDEPAVSNNRLPPTTPGPVFPVVSE